MKIILIIYNLIFWLIGLLIIIAGSVLYVEAKNLGSNMGSQISIGLIVIICVGVFIFIVSTFGLFGSCKENVCMIRTYAVLVIIVLIFEFAVGIAALVLSSNVGAFFHDSFMSQMLQYSKTVEDRLSVDLIQQGFDCCGADNYTNWNTMNITAYNNGSLPPSCCSDVSPNCKSSNLTTVFTNPCVQTLQQFTGKQLAIIGGCVLGVCVIEIVAVILAFCLIRSIHNYEAV